MKKLDTQKQTLEEQVYTLSRRFQELGLKEEKLALKDRIKRMELIMDIYRGILQTNDKFKIHLLGELCPSYEFEFWEHDYCKKRDNKELKKQVALEIFSILFNSREKENDSLSESDIRLGLFILDFYNKTTRGIKTSFFDKHFYKQKDYEPLGIKRQNITFKKIIDTFENFYKLTNHKTAGELSEVLFLYGHSFRSYFKLKKYYKKALEILNEEKNKNKGHKKSSLSCLYSDHLTDLIQAPEKLINNYLNISKFLKENFLVSSYSRYRDCVNVYKNFENFLKNGNKRFDTSNYILTQVYNSAVRDYCLDFIKILKRKNSRTLNEVISKLYVLYSTFGKEEYELRFLNKTELKYLKTALKFNPNNLVAYYDLAKYYEKNGDRNKSLEMWKKLAQSNFTNYKHKNFTESKNGILKIVDHPYVFDPLLIKKGKNLEREYFITDLIYHIILEKDLTSKPAYYFRDKMGYTYIVLRKAEGTLEGQPLSLVINHLNNLKPNEEIFSKVKWASETEIIDNFKISYLKKAVDNLIKIQTQGRKNKTLSEYIFSYDYEKKLKKKLNKAFPVNAKNLFKKCIFVTKYLNKQPRIFSHCDFHLDNILEIEGDFCTVDYENASYASNTFDIIYLLEQEALNLKTKQKNKLYSYFIQKSKMGLMNKNEVYDYHALYINLLGMSTFADERQQKYLIRVNEIIDKMGAYLQVDELKQLNELKEELYKL